MSRIDELVSEMCPRGVEIRRLGQVGTFTRGNGLQKKDFVDSGVGCIHYGQIYTHYGTSATATKSFVAPEMAARLRMAKPGDLVVATTSENDEDVCKAVAWLGQAPVAVSGVLTSIRTRSNRNTSPIFFRAATFRTRRQDSSMAPRSSESPARISAE